MRPFRFPWLGVWPIANWQQLAVTGCISCREFEAQGAHAGEREGPQHGHRTKLEYGAPTCNRVNSVYSILGVRRGSVDAEDSGGPPTLVRPRARVHMLVFRVWEPGYLLAPYCVGRIKGILMPFKNGLAIRCNSYWGHRSHFGSRYNSGCCGYAGLFLAHAHVQFCVGREVVT